MDLDRLDLDAESRQAVSNFLAEFKNSPPHVEDIWRAVDRVWDEMGCDTSEPDSEKVRRFYRHPVWILNALFTEQDEESIRHRRSISNWIIANDMRRVLDYGGGFGTLARMISEMNTNISIDIFEPDPSLIALSRASMYPNIRFIDNPGQSYDGIISIDVLEHLPDPLRLFLQWIDLIRMDGYLIIAHCFYPVVKCHLPDAFHLRYSFNIIARLMNLERIGPCEGSHATVFRKVASAPLD